MFQYGGLISNFPETAFGLRDIRRFGTTFFVNSIIAQFSSQHLTPNGSD
jgi:hypothetical protein